MNLQQLIELAVLDAMGLLDDAEQGQFESAFRAASPEVQAQVRREQTRLSVIDGLLPNVSPPAGLRAAVLDAVRREITAAGLAEADGVAGVLPPMIQSTRVSPLWRTAALGLAAAAVVMSVASFEIYSRFNEVRVALNAGGITQELVDKFGGPYVHDVLFSKDTRRVVFSPGASGSKGQIAAFFNPEWKEAKLFHFGLGDAEGRTYRLALVDESDHVVAELTRFNPNGAMEGVSFVLDRPAPKSHLAVLTTDRSGKDQIVQTGELPVPTL